MDKADCGKSKDFSWSRTTTESLIHLYENYPCLYCTTSADYKNKNKRFEAFRLIAEQLNAKMMTNLSPKDIQNKIHGLRTQYLSEAQKVKKSKVSGTSPDNIYCPKWFYFSMLSFLDAQGMIVSQGESNLTVRRDEQNQNQSEVSAIESDTTLSQPQQCEVIFDGDIEEIGSVSLLNSPQLLSPEATMFEDVRATPASSSYTKAEGRGLNRKKLSSTPQSDAAKLIDHATRALSQIQNEPVTNTHMHFAQ